MRGLAAGTVSVNKWPLTGISNQPGEREIEEEEEEEEEEGGDDDRSERQMEEKKEMTKGKI